MNPVSSQSIFNEQHNTLLNPKNNTIDFIKITSNFIDLLNETFELQKDTLKNKKTIKISSTEENNKLKSVIDVIDILNSRKNFLMSELDKLFLDKAKSNKNFNLIFSKEKAFTEYYRFVEACISWDKNSKAYAVRLRKIAQENLPKESNNNPNISLQEFKNWCINFVENASNSL